MLQFILGINFQLNVKFLPMHKHYQRVIQKTHRTLKLHNTLKKPTIANRVVELNIKKKI